MSKQNKNAAKDPRDPNVANDPLLNVPADTRTEREKFVDEFAARYQDKNPREQADAITWAIETLIVQAMGVPALDPQDKKTDTDPE